MTSLPGAVTGSLADRPAAWGGAALAVARDLLALTKPRIISLLLFTSIAGAVAGAAGRPSLLVMLTVTGGGAMAAGGANALNCSLEGDLDRKMARTRSRPVPSGRLPAWVAATWGLALTAGSAAWFALATSPVAAAVSLLGGAWYVVIYTAWLKRRSPQNIVIGGAAGCFPPVVGWAASSGRVSLTAVTLAVVIFCWTPPHFWALATMLRADYRSAGVPMLPVVSPLASVARQMRWYAVATLLVSVAPITWGGAGWIYTLAAAALGVWFVRLTWAYPAARSRASVLLFHGSLLYLFALFVALAADALLRGWL